MQDGAYSFVEKPYEPRRLLNILRHAAERTRMRAHNARLKDRLLHLSGLDRLLVGSSATIERLKANLLNLADTTAPILIQGETGTGKDLVARALHDIGPMAERPFVAVNCAMLSPERFAMEMFGTADGPDGLIHQANGGTLFLDEICACPPDVQARFLRVLEDDTIQPEGGSDPSSVRVRVIAVTNQDVAAAIQDGRFREDLYYRLNTFPLELPPLRDRRDDIIPLLAHFFEQLAPIFEVEVPEITAADMASALSHDWPGNVRELRTAAQRRLLAERQGRGRWPRRSRPERSKIQPPVRCASLWQRLSES